MRRNRRATVLHWAIAGALVCPRLAAQPISSAPAPAVQAVPQSSEPPALPGNEVPFELHRIAIDFDLGVTVLGWGAEHSECNGSACGTATEGVRRFDQKLGAMAQLGAFYRVIPLVRVGPTLLFNPATAVAFKNVTGASRSELGSILSLDAAVELTPRVGRRVWLVPRLQSGFSVLMPSGTLSNRLAQLKRQCDNSGGAFGNCASLSGARFGGNLGTGLGVIVAVTEQFALRFNGLLEFYSFRMASLTAGGADAEYVDNASGSRLSFSVGLEL